MRKLNTRFIAVLITTCAVIALAQQPANAPDETTVVLRYLTQTVSWYRSVLLQQQMASDAADVVFAENSRNIALQVLRLSFDFGHADAALLQVEARRNNTD